MAPIIDMTISDQVLSLAFLRAREADVAMPAIARADATRALTLSCRSSPVGATALPSQLVECRR
jgi:hypothetical protein